MKLNLIVIYIFFFVFFDGIGIANPIPPKKNDTAFNQYFKLEKKITLSQEKKLIGRIRRLCIDKAGYFWVLDSKNRQLHKFNSNGEYIYSRGGRGQAPGEYISPTDFFIGKENIYVTDAGAMKLNVLDLNGNFKYFFIIQDGRTVLEGKDGNIIIGAPLMVDPKSSTCIQVYTPKGKLIKSFLPICDPAIKCGLFSDNISFNQDKENNLYCVQEMEYKIHKFSSLGQPVKTFSRLEPHYIAPPNGPIKNKYLRSEVDKWIKSWSHLIGISVFGNRVIVTLDSPANTYEYTYDIYNTNGDFIIGGLAFDYRLLLTDENGMFYFLQEEDKTDNDFDYNILIYSSKDSKSRSKYK